MSFTTVIEYCKDTDLYIGHILGISGAHSQGVTIR